METSEHVTVSSSVVVVGSTAYCPNDDDDDDDVKDDEYGNDEPFLDFIIVVPNVVPSYLCLLSFFVDIITTCAYDYHMLELFVSYFVASSCPVPSVIVASSGN